MSLHRCDVAVFARQPVAEAAHLGDGADVSFWLQVFVLLMAEMALFMLLIVPLPFAIKRKMFT